MDNGNTTSAGKRELTKEEAIELYKTYKFIAEMRGSYIKEATDYFNTIVNKKEPNYTPEWFIYNGTEIYKCATESYGLIYHLEE